MDQSVLGLYFEDFVIGDEIYQSPASSSIRRPWLP